MSNEIKDTDKRALFSRLRKTAADASQLEKAKQRTPRVLPRPPFAVDEALFLEMCTGCSACVEACPTGVIALSNDKAYLDLDFNHCSHCGRCVEVCESKALNVGESRNIDALPNFTSICNNYLSSPCRACASSCPKEAISVLKNEIPTLNRSLCDGCGLCRNACYIGAITMDTHTNL